MIAPRSQHDVSSLPDFAFDHKTIMWWGTLCFIAIEGTTILVCVSSYLYLWRNFETWPPAGTPLPGLFVPTLAVLTVLLSTIPAAVADRRARAFDATGVRRALVVHAGAGTLLLVLRVFEFLALRTRWDEHAYGSIAWTVLAVHTAIVLTDVADTYFSAAVFLRGKEENKHFSGVCDNSLYWYFVVASWLLVYVVLFLSPRFL